MWSVPETVVAGDTASVRLLGHVFAARLLVSLADSELPSSDSAGEAREQVRDWCEFVKALAEVELTHVYSQLRIFPEVGWCYDLRGFELVLFATIVAISELGDRTAAAVHSRVGAQVGVHHKSDCQLCSVVLYSPDEPFTPSCLDLNRFDSGSSSSDSLHSGGGKSGSARSQNV